MDTERDATGFALDRALDVVALGTSRNPKGFGPPYGPPWFIVDTVTADHETNHPGELVKEVSGPGEVGRVLREARIDVLARYLTPKPRTS